MRNMSILTHLTKTALERSKVYPDNSFRLRGLWCFDLLFQPNMNERIFSYRVVLAQCVGQGCCYTEENPILDRKLIGRDARKVHSTHRSVDIAVLDAIYSTFDKNPHMHFSLEGPSTKKSVKRTAIVINQVMNELKNRKNHGEKPSVVNVGAVGNFIEGLKRMQVKVFATDRDPMLIGKTLGGVTVESSERTVELLEDCDVGLITGMTLSTGTLDEIIATALKHKTKLVMFAETGANFAEEYCKLGVDVVISEPFPFYIFQGKSIIDIYKRRTLSLHSQLRS